MSLKIVILICYQLAGRFDNEIVLNETDFSITLPSSSTCSLQKVAYQIPEEIIELSWTSTFCMLYYSIQENNFGSGF